MALNSVTTNDEGNGSPSQFAMSAGSMDLDNMDVMDLGLEEEGCGGGAAREGPLGITSATPDGGADKFAATLMKLESLNIEADDDMGTGNTKPMRNRHKSIDVTKLDGFDDQEFFNDENIEGGDGLDGEQEDSSLACLAAEVLDSYEKEEANASPGPANSSSHYDESSPDYPKDKKRLTITAEEGEAAAPSSN